jgi:ATP-dependent HslUV protease ATP-binding subunit HslU
MQVNEMTENIGARRLQTVLERVLEEVSFEASEHNGQSYVIDAAYVDARVQPLLANVDLTRYIL